MNHCDPCRTGMIFLFMLGLITVLLVLAFAFVTTMQMARGTSRSVRMGELAVRAAEMGMQHAIAVSTHEYAMPNMVQDMEVVPAHSILDAPHKNVFNVLSPRISSQERDQQPPQPGDLPPDVSFQDLFSSYIDGTYRSEVAGPAGFSEGWTMNRGYARYFEANRFNYQRQVVYDPSSYDPDSYAVYLPADPNPGAVRSPFPPVDPFSQVASLASAHALDHPLWLDGDLRPIDPHSATGGRTARYRLRYAVNVQDLSAALWLNTDMPWLTEPEKVSVRTAYSEAIPAVGTQMGEFVYNASDGNNYIHDYGIAMASIFLGYGQYGNSRFSANGVPLEWPERGGATMAYRGTTGFSGAGRTFHNVHGSPFMNWNDPIDASHPSGRRWLGSTLTSWNDIGFALQDHQKAWALAGETLSANAQWRGHLPVRGDHLAQRASTPFGKPSGNATDHPWSPNVLIAPMRVVQAMIAAYVPPAARTLAHPPSPTGWGVDLFTDAYLPDGRRPFDYTTPANRDYWRSPAANRRNHVPVVDSRANAERYPGVAFFSHHTHETQGKQCTVWHDLSTVPRQTRSSADDPAAIPLNGFDHLGRHIVFYNPIDGSANVGNFSGYYSSYYQPNIGGNTVVPQQAALRWRAFFTPVSPFGRDISARHGSTYRHWHGHGGAAMDLYQIRHHNTGISTAYSRGNAAPAAPNSYWNRLALAFGHTVMVTQVAHLAWADPQDPRSQAFPTAPTYSPPYGAIRPITGILYHALVPPEAPTQLLATRKGPATGWNPAAADFATLEQIDRQFLANLGESFDTPGVLAPSQALTAIDPSTGSPRPPRFIHCYTDSVRKEGSASDYNYRIDHLADPTSASYGYGSFLSVGEYRVTNNIRTLLTPIDVSVVGATLTPRSTDIQTGLQVPPRNLWLLDEWNAGSEGGYTPGTLVGDHPTALARTRAKLMERVLNDWRLSFLGSAESYADHFRPKDFDGDGIVFCSGYLNAAGGVDPDTGLTCWQPADLNGNGPGNGVLPGDPAGADPSRRLTIFSVTGCFTFKRSNQYKLQVRGELFDNVLGSAVAEHYLESALLIDPDGNVNRAAALPTGLTDTKVLMQRPIHNYYRGYLSRVYP